MFLCESSFRQSLFFMFGCCRQNYFISQNMFNIGNDNSITKASFQILEKKTCKKITKIVTEILLTKFIRFFKCICQKG